VDARIAVQGEVDIAEAPELLRRLQQVIDDHPSETVEADMGRVTFIDSTGLGTLLAAQKRARATGGDLVIVNAGPNVRKILEITGLDRVLTPTAT
jgi:anti-anti-sigma factor